MVGYSHHIGIGEGVFLGDRSFTLIGLFFKAYGRGQILKEIKNQ